MDYRKWTYKYSTDCKLKYNSESTQSNYISCVKQFLIHFNNYREPKEITNTKIKEWLLEAKTVNTRKHRLCAINSFYKITVGMPSKITKIPYPKSEKKLPRIIESEFLKEQIFKIDNLKHKTIIMLGYSCGLRVSEVINLKIEDIDSKRMVINVRNAKGRKDRIVILSETMLETLRNYYKEFNPSIYLFNGQFDPQYSTTSCNKIVKKYIGKDYHFHLLRHSHATTILESGVDMALIQKLLGHNNIKTTQIYGHVSTNLLSKIKMPI